MQFPPYPTRLEESGQRTCGCSVGDVCRALWQAAGHAFFQTSACATGAITALRDDAFKAHLAGDAKEIADLDGESASGG
jgi:hypothetical protein